MEVEILKYLLSLCQTMSKRTYLRSLASTLPKEAHVIADHLRFKAITYRNNVNKESEASLNHCIFCGNIFTPESCRVRLRSKSSLNRNMKKLLERNQTNPGTLSKYQGSLVQRYLKSKNMMIKTCLVCSKPSKFPAQAREWPTKRVKLLKSAPNIEEVCSNEAEKKLTKKQKKRLKKKHLKNVVPGDNVKSRENHPTGENPSVQSAGLSTTTVTKTPNKNLPKHNKSVKNITSPSGNLKQKFAGKNRHQQLSKMLAQEKKDTKTNSLSMFLSAL